jgi:hypothetical protein
VYDHGEKNTRKWHKKSYQTQKSGEETEILQQRHFEKLILIYNYPPKFHTDKNKASAVDNTHIPR